MIYNIIIFYIHTKNILHRDLKSENLALDVKDIKLTALGITKIYEKENYKETSEHQDIWCSVYSKLKKNSE